MEESIRRFVLNKRIIKINRQDEYACARAIVVSKSFADKHPFRYYLVEDSELQKSFAEDIHEDAGIEPGVCGLAEIKLLQKALPEYQFIYIWKTNNHISRISFGPDIGERIYIYEHNGTYSTFE